nr:hypothetical protein [Tanacetum cinerariifolium]
MARQCTQPKWPRNIAWYKEKAMLAEAQKSGQILDEEQIAFLAGLGIPDGQAAQTTISNTAAIQTMDLDAYDFDCDDVFIAKAVLMANLSNYSLDVISKVPHFKPYHTDVDNQSRHAIQNFEQTPVVDFTDNEITILCGGLPPQSVTTDPRYVSGFLTRVDMCREVNTCDCSDGTRDSGRNNNNG